MAERFIGQLAAELGLNPRTLRYYEGLGLLPAPARTMSGYRVYGADTAQQLVFITKAKSLGLTLKEIKQILALRESGTLPCPAVQRLLQEHIERINRQIVHLRALKADLTALLSGWNQGPRHNGKTMPGTICPRVEEYRTPRGRQQYRDTYEAQRHR